MVEELVRSLAVLDKCIEINWLHTSNQEIFLNN